MKLRYSATSPYVRKVMAVAIETGLADRIEKVETNVWSPDTDIRNDNPLGKVPALTLDGGTVLFDSPVIAEYLDSLHEGRPMFPAPGPDRWVALRLQAIADGLCDACVLRLLESRREDPPPAANWIERYTASMTAALDVLEAESASLGDMATIGTLSVACALGYIDLRFAGDEWRKGRPLLASWYEGFAKRPSIAETVPPAG